MTPVVVFDCMVYVQAVGGGRGPAADCLERALNGEFIFLLSKGTFAEITDVLQRPRLREKLKGLTQPVIDEYLRRALATARIVEPVPPLFTLERDPKDAPYLNLAIAGRATHLVSRDNDLLDLENRRSPESDALKRLAPLLRIVDPASFLAQLRRGQPE